MSRGSAPHASMTARPRASANRSTRTASPAASSMRRPHLPVEPLGALMHLFAHGLHVLLRPILDAGEVVAGAARRHDELVELELERDGVAILGVLDEED